MSYLRPPSPYETAPPKRPRAPSPSKFEIGQVIGLSFAIIRQRWLVLGLFLVAYFALDWTLEAVWSFRNKTDVQDWRPVLGVATYLGFSCLRWFRDTALTAVALPTAPTPSSIWSSAAHASAIALRSFPALLPFFIVSELPEIADQLWRFSWQMSLPPGRWAEVLLATTFGEVTFALAVTGAWGIVVPVVAVEQAGLLASMQRAWRLLSGNRWRLVAILAVVTVIAALPSTLAEVFMRPIYNALHLNGRPRDVFRAELEVARVLGSIVTATWQVMVGVTYLELTRVREGIVVGEVAEVFA
jgi:hypothetical protein